MPECNCNLNLFTKLLGPRDSEGTFRSLSQKVGKLKAFHADVYVTVVTVLHKIYSTSVLTVVKNYILDLRKHL